MCSFLKYLLPKYRRRSLPCESVEKEVKALRQQPIQVHEFVNKLHQKKLDMYLNFEVRAIVHHQVEYPCTIAIQPENFSSNVTQDVVPYDHSLVKIEGFSLTKEEMYINASYIQGYSTHKGYIATQGPRGNTVAAFWQMVWQQDVHVIVMATGLFEHAVQQCEKYWGSVRSADKYVRYGDMHIHLTDTRQLAKLTIRTFQIFPEGSDLTRTIQHFEMAGFTDDGAEPGFLLEVRRRVNHALDQVPGPLLVHCRCGGSRTATYIAIDYCIRQLEQENFVDIFSTVLHLRKFRTNMIRTLSQYRLIYDTVALYIQVRSTVIPCAILPTTTQTMSITDPQTNTNGYQKEFQLLDKVVPKISIGECASGHREENRKKSRDIMMLPPERARPYLQTIEMSESGTDFINAVLVDGFHQESSYIVTQWPMDGTLNDIWRLLFDYKINTLIVLHENKTTRSTPCFWPKVLDQEIRYGPIGVKYLGCQKYPHIVIRAFAIQKRSIGMLDVLHGTGRREPIVVKMFQFTGWHARDQTPTPTKAFLYMMGAIRDWRGTTTSSKPVCIMSKDGFTRCGVYCTLAYCWDQLEMEAEVDVFNAARIIKRNRPQMLSTMAEYMYCYSYLTLAVQLKKEALPSVILTVPPVIEAEIAEGYELLTGFQNIMSSQTSLTDCHNQGPNGTCGVSNGGHRELLSNQIDLDLDTGIKNNVRNGLTSSAQLNRKLSAPKTQGRIHNRDKPVVQSDSKPVLHNKKDNLQPVSKQMAYSPC
ncbi:receptor-type tyrosine-protein phosphatase mu-like isoform X2 [Dreissena polymorpha]|uniref:receptor-type tyrosine-protein phosphatase mu-like isoform X2 n=1 Tax=Dreissena polymorpha TaxID=45954 RepID=UPI002264E53A|nr:receptor-type tyrosine-protein phosphatase mu-like isoform X2 [Dreissena polymorpha]XP_052280408.1 receptor-type tyrosine-protein phosphatase mu-like isoform X2 [Dreissena polymorpha]